MSNKPEIAKAESSRKINYNLSVENLLPRPAGYFPTDDDVLPLTFLPGSIIVHSQFLVDSGLSLVEDLCILL